MLLLGKLAEILARKASRQCQISEYLLAIATIVSKEISPDRLTRGVFLLGWLYPTCPPTRRKEIDHVPPPTPRPAAQRREDPSSR
jgi:hypothetical protein